MGKLVPNGLEIPIVGLQHRVTPSTRRKLEEAIQEGTISVRIKREPDNQFDENAIRVIITGAPYKGMHIGYIPRIVAAEMAPSIDNGDIDVETALGEMTDVDAQNGTAMMYLKFKAAVIKKKGAKRKKA